MNSRRRHAEYGTACSECSRTKSRCIATTPGSPCERCKRLGKDCVASNNKRKPKNQTSVEPSQSSQLEAKIDGLVTLITNNTQATGSSLSLGNFVSPTVTRSQGGGDLFSYVKELCLSINEDGILSHFTQTHLPHLPFLSLSSELSPSSLRHEKPFLWLCIVAISSTHTIPQASLNDKIRSIVAERIVLNLERSVELLQGLLVCIAWGNFQVHQRPFLTLFTQLANTMVFDLGLNQPPQAVPEAMLRLTIHRPWVSATRSVEEQRAVVACYYLSSVVSSYMRRTDRLLWTPYLSTCLEDLSNTGVPSDLAIVSMVKIRKILERASYSPPNSQKSVSDVPAEFIAAMLQTELAKLTTESPHTAERPITSCHLTYASFAISEFALSSPSPDPQHLYSTYEALEAYFNSLLSFQPTEYPGFTLAELYQMMHATLSTRKLSSRLTTSTYDEQRVGLLTGWFQQVKANLREAATCPGVNPDGRAAVLGKLADMLESFGGDEMEGSGRLGEGELRVDGIGSEVVLGEEWLGVMDQFGWSF